LGTASGTGAIAAHPANDAAQMEQMRASVEFAVLRVDGVANFFRSKRTARMATAEEALTVVVIHVAVQFLVS